MRKRSEGPRPPRAPPAFLGLPHLAWSRPISIYYSSACEEASGLSEDADVDGERGTPHTCFVAHASQARSISLKILSRLRQGQNSKVGKEKKPINIRNFGGTPHGLCPVCPVTCPVCPVICPVCPADILPLECEFPHDSAQTSWVSLGRPEFKILSTGRSRAFPPPDSFMGHFFVGFFSKRRLTATQTEQAHFTGCADALIVGTGSRLAGPRHHLKSRSGGAWRA